MLLLIVLLMYFFLNSNSNSYVIISVVLHVGRCRPDLHHRADHGGHAGAAVHGGHAGAAVHGGAALGVLHGGHGLPPVHGGQGVGGVHDVGAGLQRLEALSIRHVAPRHVGEGVHVGGGRHGEVRYRSHLLRRNHPILEFRQLSLTNATRLCYINFSFFR